jgi:hypothetical protein
VGRIWIKDHWYNVEYEGLHIICGKYGCYGNYDRDYKLVRGIGPTTVESNATLLLKWRWWWRNRAR